MQFIFVFRERNREILKPVSNSNGDSLEDELDAASMDFDSIDYNITESTMLSDDPLGLRRLPGDSDLVDSVKVCSFFSGVIFSFIAKSSLTRLSRVEEEVRVKINTFEFGHIYARFALCHRISGKSKRF